MKRLKVLLISLVCLLFSLTPASAQEGIEVWEGAPGEKNEMQSVSEGENYYVTAYLRSKDFWDGWCDTDVDKCELVENLDPYYYLMSQPGVAGAFLFTYQTQYTGTYVGYFIGNEFFGELCNAVESLGTTYCFRGIWHDGITYLLEVERLDGSYEVDVLVVSELVVDIPEPEEPVSFTSFLPLIQ
jgi:hypothetical protein